MSVFSLKEFGKKNTNTKIKVFIEYLYEKYGISGDNEEFDNTYFYLFNDDDLIESLEYYIEKNSITAQVTAQNYITYITDFFNMLSNDYNIKNDTFINIDLYNKLLSKSKKIIFKLKLSESKEYATDEQYEILNNGIDKFLNELVIGDIYDEIIQFKSGKIKHVKLYYRFVSAIAIKLIMKFAFSNSTTISLEANNLDMVNNTINVNGFRLELGKELTDILKKYLSVRRYILNLYSIEESKLFIKLNGKQYKNKKNIPEYSSFFKIMDDLIKTRAADLFSARRILEMLDKGIDISIIVKLSDKSIEKCIELQNNNEDEANKKLQLLFNEDKYRKKRIITKKKGYLKCPFCNNEVKAISDEWILVQFENDNVKYLACRKCRGANGENI
ncbi:hypothetical protein FC816_00625 [Clostridium botulinum]|uniref:Uncharacterized protein n=1 Tax=Clostridium botulinum TaxID=1491 RepID=A0A6B4FZ11_CLOBO|nr:hypothetical protein [Clostridium botulinum]MBN3382930.1 hypothetical protein [Clostridium botulinum]NFF90079.1 hypothetical protein [Clostridium botulinum]NFG16865.1 hypothetical protein [Clostridium botulinum]NFG30630.1 hypothetical protein [Clostridium botulinum]NFG33773.1 hypothetical protein [Clostridium botulinum]